ncbi:MAG: tetratricopeptide repeat protein [Bacteroidetes bacterium]|nr:tetratricopeptide repeat protein [Bacteroidota bacterium]
MKLFVLKPKVIAHTFGFFLLTAGPLFSVAQQKLAKTQKWEAQADTLMAHDDFKSAAQLYSKILSHLKKEDPHHDPVLYKRALSYYRLQDADRALNDINTYLEKNTDSSKAYLLRALINQLQDDEEKLLPDVDRAIRLGNTNPQLLRWRATLWLGKGDFAEAKKEFIHLKKFSDDPELETNLALAYHALNHTDSALVCINKAIELDPNFLGAYLYGASFLIDAEYYTEALDYLSAGLKIDSKNGALWLYKGVALIELKRTDEACRCLRKAFDAGEEDAVDYLKENCYEVYKD